MKIQNLLFSILFLLLFKTAEAQHTVGLLSYNPDKAYEGYNLFFPDNQEKVYLLNNCGEIVNVWEDAVGFRPGSAVYLQDNGDLIKCKRHVFSNMDPIWAGGGGAIVEILDWDNNLLWSFEQNDALHRLHHDIAPMPNGNILMISWENKSSLEASLAGRDTTALVQGQLWPDYILEINPSNNEIVWEWHTWDHLVQDFNSEKENFGIVANHPELIDVNWLASEGDRDWMHTNAIDYNEVLDQIVISVPTFNEIWIIDHSTTTEEAAGHSGGLAGRGGDLLYRWGNSAAYSAGTIEDQKLFFQHDIHWINGFVDASNPHYGKMAVFNNRVSTEYSTANIFAPEFDESTWSYPMENDVWGPADFDVNYSHPQPSALFSRVVSSTQLLPNNNMLICSGKPGYIFELTPQNEIVWEYKNPFSNGTPITQGEVSNSNNLIFRFNRYPENFAGFEGRMLEPIGYIELNPDTIFCELLLPLSEVISPVKLKMYPNPATHEINFEQDTPATSIIEIFDFTGKKKLTFKLNGSTKKVDTSNYPPGLYFVHINQQKSLKFVVNK